MKEKIYNFFEVEEREVEEREREREREGLFGRYKIRKNKYGGNRKKKLDNTHTHTRRRTSVFFRARAA